jgi:hypothetical protein
MSIIDDLLPDLDDVLGLRDEIGAVKEPIYILTRTWDAEKGKGSPVDTFAQILPTPYLVDLSHSINLKEGGSVKQGDLLLKMISKASYPEESDVDCSSSDRKIEKWYWINGRTYEVISVKQDYVTWAVQIRKTIKNIITQEAPP